MSEPPTTSLDHFKPFKLSTALMAVHKDCYAPIGLIQQGGPRRRETIFRSSNLVAKDQGSLESISTNKMRHGSVPRFTHP